MLLVADREGLFTDREGAIRQKRWLQAMNKETNKMWSVGTDRCFVFERETVGAFLTRNSLSVSKYLVGKVIYRAGKFFAHEVLLLDAYLAPPEASEHFYYLSELGPRVEVLLNRYTRQYLGTECAAVSFVLASGSFLSDVRSLLEHVFSSQVGAFSFFSATETEWGPELARASEEAPIHLGSAYHLQATSPFRLACSTPPSFSGVFLQLDALNSLTLLAKRYSVRVYEQFILAVKEGEKKGTGQCIEITGDVRAFKQKVGSRTFAVIETHGTRWSLYAKAPGSLDRLLKTIAQAPRHQPRAIEGGGGGAWSRHCTEVEALLRAPETSSSMVDLMKLFPNELPGTGSLCPTTNREAAVLLQKLDAHLQRSIWDNVTIEFIVYLLSAQSVSLVEGMHGEIREFSKHRKRLLSQLRVRGCDRPGG
ncbi:hypothetical protein NEDG_00027 [Nematocida displodere]|uniref:Uncharacterized protein n=1 Tax=Nematocida displodere TaxID=1805483 RepID=A0A177EKA4_9MICR|nr:hypothetical protein NEDG_00027 [Nematocida displodere]